METPVLFLIRHGRTDLNARNLFRGNVNVPLDKVGFQDAEEAAEFLKDKDPGFLVSSDKLRAVQTAEIFEKKFGLENTQTSDLRAWNIGKFSGKERNKENVEELQKYIDNPDLRVPEGESLTEFRERVAPVLDECFDYAHNNGVGFIICHSSVVHEAGNILNGSHTSLLVEPGGIVVIGYSDGKITASNIFKKAKQTKPPAKRAETIS
jgi:broad specificity phosphatase PhoE